jgi:uncharacterized membrane protein YebE (DUF533 family)
MFDPRRLLDAMLGVLAQPARPESRGSTPEVTGAARRPGAGVSGTLATLGGLAAIGALAYRAWQNRVAAKPPVDPDSASSQQPDRNCASPAPGTPVGPTRDAFRALDVPADTAFAPVSQTEDDVLLYLRTMIAAVSADGNVDRAERQRIIRGLSEADIDPAASRWLDDQFADPPDVDELAATTRTPERAAQVYAAARIAIDPDTLQEREFLRLLAEALGLDPALRAQIDDAASTLRA